MEQPRAMEPNAPTPPGTDAPPCPFCGGARTEIMSLFGSHASLTTCWCADCRSPFEFLRWRDPETHTRAEPPGTATGAAGNMDRRRGVE